MQAFKIKCLNFILMDVSYIIFLEMKKFQLGPHMNLYKIGF